MLRISCRPHAPCLRYPLCSITTTAPGRAVGRRALPGQAGLPHQGTEHPGGKPRPRRVGFGAAVCPFRHISERVRALQSQPADCAARATDGRKPGIHRVWEGLACKNQGICEAGCVFMQRICARAAVKSARRAVGVSFSPPGGGDNFAGDKRMCNLADDT